MTEPPSVAHWQPRLIFYLFFASDSGVGPSDIMRLILPSFPQYLANTASTARKHLTPFLHLFANTWKYRNNIIFCTFQMQWTVDAIIFLIYLNVSTMHIATFCKIWIVQIAPGPDRNSKPETLTHQNTVILFFVLWGFYSACPDHREYPGVIVNWERNNQFRLNSKWGLIDIFWCWPFSERFVISLIQMSKLLLSSDKK